MPVIGLLIVVGVLLWVYITRGRISVPPEFEFIGGVALIATPLLTWLIVHLQRVDYCGRELVVRNYWRDARIPLENIAAVEPVWGTRAAWFGFASIAKYPFGSVVYYIPKRGPVRAMVSAPEEELRRVISTMT
jgi:hypothetical protein